MTHTDTDNNRIPTPGAASPLRPVSGYGTATRQARERATLERSVPDLNRTGRTAGSGVPSYLIAVLSDGSSTSETALGYAGAIAAAAPAATVFPVMVGTCVEAELDGIVSRPDVDLVVMTSTTRLRGTFGLRRGAVDITVRRSSAPVLVLPPATLRRRPLRVVGTPILVALDGTRFAERALGHAARFAGLVGSRLILGSTLALANVMPAGPYVYVPGPAALAASQQATNRYLRGVAERTASNYGLPEPDCVSCLGTPLSMIDQCAREFGVGVVAMTTHARHPVLRWLVGSVPLRHPRRGSHATPDRRPERDLAPAQVRLAWRLSCRGSRSVLAPGYSLGQDQPGQGARWLSVAETVRGCPSRIMLKLIWSPG